MTDEPRICPTCGEAAPGPDTHVCKEVRTAPARKGAVSRFETTTGPVAGAVLAGRWVLVEKAGEGGGGTVYRAYDRDLDLHVALKVLAADGTSAEVVERLKREIRITRDIDHPRVSRVFDLGESDGKTFLTMRWIDGEPLSKRVRRNGPMDRRALGRLAVGLVDALAAAHRQGVVHRDVKPANVMVAPSGDPVLVDFGIAADLDRSTLTRPRHGDRITPDGLIPGTPSFMAPEQMRGESASPASDLYSLALTLGWAATGRAGAPDDPDAAFAALPRPLRTALVRSLQAEPGLRPRDAVEIADGVERGVRRRRRSLLAGSALALALGAVALGAIAMRRIAPAAQESVPVVSVLPLENRTGDAQVDWLEHGVADLVAAGLEGSGRVRIAADDASREQASRIVGRISKDGERVAVDLELRGLDGRLRATARVADAAKGGLFDGVDRAVARLTLALGVQAPDRTSASATPAPTTDVVAFEHYARAQDFIRRHRARDALAELRQATSRDPAFAHAQLERYVLVSAGRHGPRAEADAALEQARAHRDRLPPARREMLEAVLEAVEGTDRATRFDRLRAYLRANPPDSATYWLASFVALPDLAVRRAILEEWSQRIASDPEPHNLLGYTLLRDFDEPDAAERELRTYLRLAPREANAHDSLGDFLRERDRFAEALEAYDRALAIDPGFTPAIVHAIEAAIQAGDLAQADARLARSRKTVPPASRDFFSWVQAYAAVLLLQGDVAGALGRLDEIARAPGTGSHGHVPREYEAIVRGLGGDLAGARRAAAEAERLHGLYHGAGVRLRTLTPYVEALAADRRGDPRALAAAAEALARIVPADSQEMVAVAHRVVADGLHRIRSGDPTGAAVRLLLPPVTSGPPDGAPFYAALVRARALAAAGRLGEVEAAYGEAAKRRRLTAMTPEAAFAWPACREEMSR